MTAFAQYESRPNILFIMTDQLRHDFLGYGGASFCSTPNLDRLAERSVRFSNCFTTGPLCVPARIALASGIRPHRIGALSNNSFLPASKPTYYRQLRNDGYRVGCAGKLDLAKPDPLNSISGDRPCSYAWGFTDPFECEGKMHAGSQHPCPIGPYTNYLEQKGLLQNLRDDYRRRFNDRRSGVLEGWYRDSVLPAEDFEDIFIGRYAEDWLKRAPTDYPWHFFVSFVGPHDPFDPPQRYADRYRSGQIPRPITDSDNGKPERYRRFSRGFSTSQITDMRRQYCAAITAIDECIGGILQALEKSGQSENTFIIFTSDHGEMIGDHGLHAKNVPYDPAWRIPLLISGPGISPGDSEAFTELMDIHPTICDLTGAPVLPNLDAQSLIPILSGKQTEHRSHVVTSLERFQAIRTQRYKFINNINDIPELYDLDTDPEERNNLADDNPERCATLGRKLTHDLMLGGITRG